MIQPTKYLDPDTSIIAVSTEVLEALRKQPALKYDELQGVVQSSLPDGARFNFPLALDLLYLLGLVDYFDDSDSIGATYSVGEVLR